MKQLLILLILTFSLGCSETKTYSLDSSLKEIRVEFLKIESEDDREQIYKIFAGAAEYLDHANKLNSSSDFEAILGRVRSNYGWDVDRYSSFTDEVEKMLINRGYDKPKSLKDESDRVWLREIFRDLAEATKE